MDVWKNRSLRVTLALLSALAVLMAGMVLFESDDSMADDPVLTGDVNTSGIKTGTWLITGTTLNITSENSTMVPTFDELKDYSTASSPSITSVLVKGYTSHELIDTLSGLSLDTSIVLYTGDIPTYTNKADGSTYVSSRAAGTWTYAPSTKDLTLTRGASSNYGLIYYESANLDTIFTGYYFLSEAESVLITGGYNSGGSYLFHEFTALKTFRSTDHTSMGAGLFLGLTFESITFDKLATFVSGSVNGNTYLKEVHFGDLTSINSYAFQNCTALTTVDITSSNTLYIDDYAFDGCSALVNLNVRANSTVTLDNYAFRSCTALQKANFDVGGFTTYSSVFQGDSLLQEAYLGTGMVTLGDYAFMNCSNLVKVNIDKLYQATAGALKNTGIGGYVYDYDAHEFVTLDSSNYLTLYEVTLLGSTFDSTTTTANGVFEGCKNIKKVQFGLPDGAGSGNGKLTKIGNKTFEGCTNLTVVDFNTPIYSGYLGARMFANCSSLTDVTGLGCSRFDTLGNEAFLGCTNLTNLELSDFVKSIAKNAFTGLQNLVSVDAGTSLEKIGENAFYNCSSFTTFTHGNSLTEIGASAFKSTAITSFTGGNNLETIGNNAFEGCSALASFTSGTSLNTIGSKSFSGCINLTVFDASGSALTKVGSNAFENCSKLTTVNFGDNLTHIGSSAFANCMKLATVYAGNSLQDIGSSSFKSCTALTTFTCGSSLEFIRTNAFEGCTILTTFTGSFSANPVSADAKKCTVDNYAFKECRALNSIDLGEYVRYINYQAFMTCEALEEFDLGSNLITLGGQAFYNCTSLIHAGTESNNWVMPDTLTTINGSAFYNTALESLAFGENSTIDTIETYAFQYVTTLRGTDTVDGLAVKVIKFPDTLQKINYNAFDGCTSLQGIYLSDNNRLNYIGSSAFRNCDLHGTLTFTSTLTTLNSSAFQGNTNLEGVIFNGSALNSISASCFYGCTNLATIKLDGNIESIENNAFFGCKCTSIIWGDNLKTIQYDAFRTSRIVTVDLPESVTLIGTGAFYNCDSLTTVNLNKAQLDKNNSDSCSTFAYCDSLTTVNLGTAVEDIYSSAFYQCPQLTTVVWAPSLIKIWDNAFYGCKKLSSAIMPDKVTTITYRAFFDCDALDTVYLNNVENLGNQAFYGCDYMTTLNLGNELTEVPTECFRECSRLESITFSPVLETIKGWAFAYLRSGNLGLKELVIPDSVVTIESGAFYDCRNLRELTIGKGVTYLGDRCFGFDYKGMNNQKLTTLTVPINLNLAKYTTNIDHPVFRNADQLRTIHFTVGGADSSEKDGFDYVDVRNVDNEYSRHPAYVSRSVLTTIIIDDGIVSLGDYNLYNLLNVEYLTIPISLKPVDSDSSHNFEGMTSIKNVVFTGTVGIDYSSVDGGTAHWNGKTPWAYSTVNTLTVEFSPSVTYIGKNMFSNGNGTSFSKLKNVVLDSTNNVINVGEKAFYNCSNLASDVTLNQILSLGDMCFYGTAIPSFTLGANLNEIGDRALFDMSLTSITVDPSNSDFTSSTDNVLYGQNSGSIISLIVYPAKKAGTSYIVPDTVQTIVSYAAYGAQFTTLTIPASVSEVNEYAFAAGKLRNLTINCSQPNFRTGAFADNTSLENVTLPISMATSGIFTGSNNITSYTFTGTGGSGLSPDYYINNAGNLPWSSTTKSVSVVFSEGITIIDSNMFDFPSANTCITSVILPSSLTTIGNAAFRNCNALTSFTIPDGVVSLGTDCLAGCTKILTLTVPISLNMAIDPNHLVGITSTLLKVYFTAGTGYGYDYSTVETANNYWGNTPWGPVASYTVTMNEGVIDTGSNMFLKASNLYLPSSLEVVGTNTFNGASIAVLDLKNVTTLEDCAFGNCSRITNVVIPNTLEVYSGSPFKDCTKITTVTLPININYAEGMFSGCNQIANYTFTAGTSSEGHNYSISDAAKTPWYLNLSNSKSPSLTFSPGITAIGAYMFYNCNMTLNGITYGITSVTLPSSVTTVGQYAFNGCSLMSVLTFEGQTVGTIANHAFSGCSNLTSLAVGPTTVFGAGAFSGCDKITTLTLSMTSDAVVNNTDPVFTTTQVSQLSFIGTGKGFNYSDSADSGSYYRMTPWYVSTKEINLSIGSGITCIGDNMFRGCEGLKGAFTLPDTIVEIANSSFRECQAITTFTASNVTKTGTDVFRDSSITSVNLPLLVIVKDYAFYNCANLSTATFNAATQIGAHAFQNSAISGLNNANSIDLTGITSVGEEAFMGCDDINDEIIVAVSLASIGARAFYGDVSITGLSGSLAGLTAVGESAFEGCTALAGALTLEKVKTVGDRAFYGSVIDSFTFSNQLTSLGDLALFDQSLMSISTGTNTKYVVDNVTGALYEVSGTARLLVQYPAAKTYDGDFEIASNVSSIQHYALYGANITGVLIIPSTVNVTIGDNAFSNAKFGGVNVPNTLPIANLFNNCTQIASYYFSMKSNVSGFPDDYFTVNSTALPWTHSAVKYSVEFQDGIIRLDNAMFKNSLMLDSMVIPNSVSTVGTDFVYGCLALRSLTVPADLNMAVCTGNIASLKELHFTASGNIDGCDYAETTGKLTPWYASTIDTFVMDSGITSIGEYSYLKVSGALEFPIAVTDIGKYAFYGSTTNNIVFDDALTSIGEFAFNGITVTELSFPMHLSTIGRHAFSGNTYLISLTLPDSLTDLGVSFYGCSNLTTVTLPITLDYSSGVFDQCNNIKTYTFTRGTTGIGFAYDSVKITNAPWYRVVAGSYNVSVTIQSGVISVGDYMFYNCSNGSYGVLGIGTAQQDKFLMLPNTVTTVSQYAFYGCTSTPGFGFGSGLVTVGDYAFYDCDNAKFTSVVIGEALRTIGKFAFAECDNIATVSLGSKVTSIGEGAFSNCARLSALTVPLTVNTVANDVHPAFDNCLAVTSITLTGTGAGFAYSGTDTGDEDVEGSYYQYTPWFLNLSHDVTLVFDNNSGITSIGNNTFRNSVAIAGTLSLPSTVQSIGDYAFQGCSKITGIALGNNIRYIGAYAFQSCSALAGDLVCTANLKTIGAHAFEFDSQVTGLTGEVTGVETIGEYAFNGCSLLGGDLVLTSVKTVGERAFYGTVVDSFAFGIALTNLGDLALFDQNLSSIAVDSNNASYAVRDGILYNKASTTVVQYPAKMAKDGYTVPDTVTEILHYAFYGSQITGKLTIPAKSIPIVIGEQAFSNTAITALQIPVNIPSAHLFDNCTQIAEYTFTGTVSGLESSYYLDNHDYLAWYFTDNAVEVTAIFSDGVTAVDAHMFSGFPELRHLRIPTSVSTLGSDCLKDCTGLSSLVVPINLNMALDAGSGITSLSEIQFIGSGAGCEYLNAETGKKVLWYHSTISTLTIADGITTIGSYSYLKVTGAVNLPDSIVAVGDYAFYGTTTSSIRFSPILDSIGDYAFYGCLVENLVLPSTLTAIGDRAFGNCLLLTELTIPDSLTAYTGSPFGGCAALGTATLPISIDYSEGMFAGCSALKNYNFTPGTGTGVDYTGKNTATPWYSVVYGSNDITVGFSAGINSIGAHMFDGCNYAPSSITTYGIIGTGANQDVVLSTVSVIGDYAFNGCTKIAGLTLGSSISSIGVHAFSDCAGITSLELAAATQVGAGAFSNCSGLATLTIPLSSDAVVDNSDPVFAGCTKLNTVNFIGSGAGAVYSTGTAEGSCYRYTPWYISTQPSLTVDFSNCSATSVGTNTFRDVSKITGGIVLPDTVTSLGDRAFYGTNASSFSLGPALTAIGDLALFDTSLQEIILRDNTAFVLVNGALYTSDVKTLIVVPAKMPLADFTLPDTVTSVLHFAAYGSVMTGTLTIPASVVTVGESAFASCGSLESLMIESTLVDLLGADAFLGDTGLTSVTIPYSVKMGGMLSFSNRVANYTFTGGTISGLDSTYYKLNFASMPWQFSSVDVSIQFQQGVGKVDDYMFYFDAPGKSRIVSLSLPDDLTTIGMYAFRYCDRLTNLVLPNSLSTAGVNCFYGCTNVENLTLPITFNAAIDSEKNINMCNLREVHFTYGTDGIGINYENSYANTLWYPSNGNGYAVTFDDRITQIGDYMYLRVSGVTFGASVESIGTYAFYQSGFGTVNFNSGLKTIDDKAFAETALTAVTLPASLEALIGSPFDSCAAMMTATLPITVDYSLGAFSNCGNLTNFNFIAGTANGGKAFDYTAITCTDTPWKTVLSVPATPVVKFADDITGIGDYMFCNCASGSYGLSGAVALPTSLTRVGDHAFENCRLISAVTFKANLVSIGDYAFAGCDNSALRSLTFGEKLASVGEGAFRGCNKVASLTIPVSVNTVASNTVPAFRDCSAMVSFTFIGNGDGFVYSEDTSSDAFYQYTPWYMNRALAITVSFSEGITSVGPYMFADCTGLSGDLNLKNIVTVGAHAFQNADRLATVAGSKVETVGAFAFEGCDQLTSVNMGAVTVIGDSAFENCVKLATATLTSVTTVGASAFRRSGLKTANSSTGIISMPLLTSVGDHAFDGTAAIVYGLGSDGSDMVLFGDYVFDNCASANIITVSSNLSSIPAHTYQSGNFKCKASAIAAPGALAFYADLSGNAVQTVDISSATTLTGTSSASFRNCASLSSIELNTSDGVVVMLPANCFENCTSLATVELTNVDFAGESVFRNCTSLTAANLQQATVLPQYTFYGCTQLESVMAPQVTSVSASVFENSGLRTYDSATAGHADLGGIIAIGARAFYGTAVELLENTSGVETIGESAFEGCTALAGELELPEIENIGRRAFYGTSASRFELGPELSSIGELAFFCPLNAYITVDESNQNYLTQSGILYNKDVTELIAIPAKLAVSDLSLPETLVTIDALAAYGGILNGTLTVPSGVKSIGTSAFSGCTEITKLVLHCTSSGTDRPLIGTDAFDGLTSLTSLTVPTSVKLAGVFDYDNVIQEYIFTGNPKSGMISTYYRDNFQTMPWQFATKNVRLTFSEGITDIDGYMFKYASPDTRIVSVNLPGTISAIGEYSFQNCAGLTALVIPESVQTLPATAIYGCTGIKELTVPITLNLAIDDGNIGISALSRLTFTMGVNGSGIDYSDADASKTLWYSSSNYNLSLSEGIVKIGDNMFLKPSNILTMPSTLVSIGKNAFKGAELPSITLNSGLQYIGDNAFADTQLTAIVIPDSVTTLDGYVFQNSPIVTATLPITISYGNDVFDGCPLRNFRFTAGSNGLGVDYDEDSVKNTPWYISAPSMQLSVQFGPGITHIGDHMFHGCASGTNGLSGTVTLPNSLVSLGDYVFCGCSRISSVVFDEALTTIGDCAFKGCSMLERIALGTNVRTIGANSFADCIKLVELTTPLSFNTVASDDDPAFEGCTGITTINFIGSSAGMDYSLRDKSGNNNFYQKTPWYFSRNNSITVTFADTIPSIGDYTFYNCKGITGTVTLPDSVDSIGTYAFRGCSGILVLVIEDLNVRLGNGCFSDCTNLRDLTLPISVNAVAYELNETASPTVYPAFYSSKKIANIFFTGYSGCDYTDSGEKNYAYAPWNLNTTVPMTISFDTTVTSIGNYMFYNCSMLKGSLEMPSEMRTIGDKAFFNCINLGSVDAPGIRTLGAQVFEGCSTVSSVLLPEVTILPDRTFFGCVKLTSAGLDACTSIGDEAFMNNGIRTVGSTDNVVALNGVTYIGDSAFMNSGIIDISVTGALTGVYLGDQAFVGCSSIRSVEITGKIDIVRTNTFKSATPNAVQSTLRTLSLPGALDFRADLSNTFANLTTVDISSATAFGQQDNCSGLFRNCVVLTTVNLYTSSGYTKVTLPSYMFAGCTSLTTIDMSNVALVYGHEFEGCTKLPSANLMTATSISDYAFNGCTALKDVSFPLASSIGKYSFANTGIDTLESTEAGNLNDLGEYAFSGCVNLDHIVMPMLSIGHEGNFAGCTSLKSVTFDILSDIPESMFAGCTSLTTVNIPETQRIGVQSFSGCTALSEITFNKLTSIGITDDRATFDQYADYAVFYNCSALTAVTMPAVKTIGAMAFYKCGALAYVNSPSGCVLENVNSISMGAFAETGVINVVAGGNDSTMASIGDYAFYNCGSLSSFTSHSLASIPEHLLNNNDPDSGICEAPMLQTLVLTKATAVNGSFHDCARLATVNMPKATSFADYLFIRCAALTTVTLMSNEYAGNVVNLSPGMFNGCSKLVNINFDNVQLTGDLEDETMGIFRGCSSLVSVIMPVTTQIPAGTFIGCSYLESVSAAKATDVGAQAFYSDTKLAAVEMPSLLRIGESAFRGCSALTTINPQTANADPSPFTKVLSIGDSAFRGCNFREVVLGPQTQYLGTQAFANNSELTTVVTSDALSAISAGAFQYCPVTEIHVSSFVKTIGAAAFDWTNTSVSKAEVFFNGDLSKVSATGAFVGNGRVAMTAHGDANSERYLSSDWYSNMSVVFQVERYAAISIQFDGTTSAPLSYRAVYGGRVVLPYYATSSGAKVYSFAMQSYGAFGIFASEADYAKERYAMSGDAVPVYPLLSNGSDTLVFIGYTSTEAFIKDITVESKNYNEKEMSPASQTVHYGSLFTIPVFLDGLVEVTDIQMEKASSGEEKTTYSLPVDTTSIYIGYNFSAVWLYSTDQLITVNFSSGDLTESVEVKIQSLFTVPDNVKYLETPLPGYEFAGWWTNPGQGGERAVVDETKFLGGQTWYARFAPIDSIVSLVNDATSFSKQVTVSGPYKLFLFENDLYYTDLNHTSRTLFMSHKEIVGYDVTIYYDSKALAPIGNTSEELVGSRIIELNVDMNYYAITMRFSYMGTTITDEFEVLDWGIGTATTYKDGDTVSGIAYVDIKDGLKLPQPLHDIYTLSYIQANGERIAQTEDGYFLYASNFGTETSMDLYFMLAMDQYSVRYEINDDGKNAPVVGPFHALSTVTPISVRSYECIGYEFAGYSYENEAYNPDHEYMPALKPVVLTNEVIQNYSSKCTITFYGIWKPITYTVNFNLAGYTTDEQPGPVTVYVGETFQLPSSIYRVGQQITSWHWILGETVSTETFTGSVTLEKYMVESYAKDNAITIQCTWGAKSYNVQVDPSSGTKQFIPINNVPYGSSFHLWDIGTYTRAFMMFGGWSVGEDGTKYASNVDVTLTDEMAAYGDQHGGAVTFYFVWVSNEYRVQYNLDGGEGDAPVDNNVYIVNDVDTPFTLAPESSSFYRDGYNFEGWKYSQTTSIMYNNTSGLFDSILAQNADGNGIVTFYAVWSQKEYHISYNLKGGVAGSYAPLNVMYGEDVIISAPTQAGYDFIGWRASTTATDDGHLTKGAQYLSSGSYRLWDGQRAVNVTTFRDLCSVNDSTVVFEAMWDNATYSVSYDRNGGTGTIVGEMTSIKVGQIIQLPSLSNANKVGYTFTGWSLDKVNPISAGTEFTTNMVEGGVNTVVFYAVWETNPYTVEYRYTDQQEYAIMETAYTTEFNIPSYTRVGYTFGGWSIEGADSNAYWSNDGVYWYKLGSTTVKGTYFKNLTSESGGKVTINAVWTPIQYRIIYNANGGTGAAPIDSVLYKIGDYVTLKPYESLNGTNGNKVCIGWSLDPSGGVTGDSEFTEGLAGKADATNAVTMYASWIEGLCVITLDLTGITVSAVPSGWTTTGDGIYTASVEYKSSMKEALSAWDNVTLSKDGNTFSGFSYGSDSITSNVTVTPQFEAVDMTIAYAFAAIVGAAVVGIIALTRFRF